MKFVWNASGKVFNYIATLGADIGAPRILGYPEEGGRIEYFSVDEINFLPLSTDQAKELAKPQVKKNK